MHVAVRGMLLVLTLTGPLVICSCSKRPSEATVKPNVILVVLDALRADHLGCYGYARPTSPCIDALAGQATQYTRGFATAPWTIPTHGSLFTGKLPFEHGAHTFSVSEPVNNARPLPLGNLTLAEVLKREGYEAGAFVANDGYLGLGSQFDQGFDTYYVQRVSARTLNEPVFKWLGAHADTPFFVFINYMDTHRPYNTTPRPELFDPPAVQDEGQLLDALLEAVMPGEGPIPPELVQKVVNQYDTAVANVDEAVGALVEKLKMLGLYDRTLLVVTSDHGEYLGEHYLVEHSKDVYQEVMWVPLIIKNPGQQSGRRVDTVVSSTDVPHLIFTQFPREVAARCTALFPDAPGNHVVFGENYYTRVKDLFNEKWGHRFNRIRATVYEWPYKYIHSSDGKHELYHLEQDPHEAQNLCARLPRLAQRLAQQVGQVYRTRPHWEHRGAPPALTEEQRRRLESLGYVGSERPRGESP